MKFQKLILAIGLLVVPVMSSSAADWSVPVCDRVTGASAVTFTLDEGLTLAESRPLMGTLYAYGLVTLDAGNTMLASTLSTKGTAILRSEDAGCHWIQVARLPVDELLLFAAGPGGITYGWSRGRSTLYRIEGNDTVTLSAPVSIYGLAVDPLDAAHVRVGTRDCQIYESFDGGASFALLGGPANSGSTTIFTVEFDPADFDHALCGARGAYRTEDAGSNWSTIAPFDSEDINLVHLFEFSPADPRRVWARANLDTMGSSTREILVSSDGGASFAPAIVQGEQVYDQNGVGQTVMLSNQPTMAAHADHPDLLYFTWTASSCCPYEIEGEILCRYDARLGELSAVLVEGVEGIDAVAFNPADAEVMYLGLEGVKLDSN